MFLHIIDLSPRRPVEMQLSASGSSQQLPTEEIVPSVLQAPSTPLPPVLEGALTMSGTSGGNGGSAGSRRLNFEKWEDEERLGDRSTIAPVLFANMVHPNLKTQCPDMRLRFREIQKLWRRLPAENRSQFVVSVCHLHVLVDCMLVICS